MVPHVRPRSSTDADTVFGVGADDAHIVLIGEQPSIRYSAHSR